MQYMLGSSTARKIAAVGVTAAFAAGSALLAVPAGAASVALNYDCVDPLGTTRVFQVTVDTDAPATIVAGQSFTPKMTAAVTVDADTSNLLRGVEAATVEGTAKDGVSSSLGFTVNGVAATAAATVPVTAVPAAGQVVVGGVTATGAAVKTTAAGTVSIVAGNFTAVLAGKKANGDATLLSPYKIPCTLQAGQNAVVDTVTVTAPTTTPPPAVVKVDSTATATGTYAAKSDKATVKVTVKGADGKVGTGKVKVTLKLGKKSKTVNATLNAAGKAKAVFKKITKPGTYKIKVAYAGSETQNASKAKATLKVS